MDGWVVEILKTNGLAGVFIFLMAGTIVALWIAIKVKDKQLFKLHGERALEREVLVRLVEGSNTAGRAMADATERRNDIMSDMAAAMTGQAGAVGSYEIRVTLLTEMLREKFADFRHVVDAFGESNRVSSGLLSDIRSGINKLEGAMIQVATQVATKSLK